MFRDARSALDRADIPAFLLAKNFHVPRADTPKEKTGLRRFVRIDRARDQVPEGRPRGDGLEMSIMAIRSFSSYQQWKRLIPGTSMS